TCSIPSDEPADTSELVAPLGPSSLLTAHCADPEPAEAFPEASTGSTAPPTAAAAPHSALMAMSDPARAAVECFIVRLVCISNSIRPSHIIGGCGPGPQPRCATAHDSTIADRRPARESVDVVGIIPNTLVAAATRRQGFGQTPWTHEGAGRCRIGRIPPLRADSCQPLRRPGDQSASAAAMS